MMRAAFSWCLGLLLCVAAGLAGAVDANTASSDELQSVRGIGPAMAARILEERRKGAFRDAGDLRERVRGIGPKNLDKMLAAGLEVRAGGHPVDAIGSGRVNERTPGGEGAAVAAEPAPLRPRIEYHIGRAR